MYVKNISQLFGDNTPLKLKFLQGSILNGKIISLEEGKGAIKLYDGTIIPALFVSENGVEKDKYIKFSVQGFDGEHFILKYMDDASENLNEQSMSSIIKDLHLPEAEGKSIIMSLLKFNLPATNQNILSVFKNLIMINALKNMTDSELDTFLKNNFPENITPEDKEYKAAKDLILNFKHINVDFLSFIAENDIPGDFQNITKTLDFLDNKFFFNSIIEDTENKYANLTAEKLYQLLENRNDAVTEEDPNKSPDMDTPAETNISEKINQNIKILKQIVSDIQYSFDSTASNGIEEINSSGSNINNLTENLKVIKQMISEMKGSIDSIILKGNEITNSSQEGNIHLLANVDDIRKIISQIDTLSKSPVLLNSENTIISNSSKDQLSASTRDLKQILLRIHDLSDSPILKDIRKLNSLLSANEKLIVDSITKHLSDKMNLNPGSLRISSLEQTIETIKSSKDFFTLISPELQRKLLDNIDILTQLNNNYSTYFFNLNDQTNIYKNRIIIKNKYKGSKYIDINDVKAYISVDTSKLGTIECNLYKKNNDLSISISVDETHISFFRKSLKQLNDSLRSRGYNVINISIEKLKNSKDLLPFSDFFSESILKELDVKV